MEILLNPNIAYLILAFGLMITILAILSPGTGVLEISAVFILIVVGWIVYNLSFNAWALILLLVGFVFFFLAVRYPKRTIYLIIAIITLVVGSAYLFPSDEWWIPAVNPILALISSILMTGFFWVATHKVLETRNVPPRQDLSVLLGETGEAKTNIHDEGTVLINSELWSAKSQTPIPGGTRVRVTDREGFVLIVEPVNNAD